LPGDLTPHPGTPPSSLTDATTGALITRGADAVHLAEELFLRLFVMTLAFVLVASGLSVWINGVGHRSSGGLLTISLATLGAAFALTGLARPRQLYCWLRYSPAHQLAPAGAVAVAMLINGPESPSWWIALALLLLVASVSSLRLALLAATIAAGAFLGGTIIHGVPVINAGDVGVLAGTIGLIAYTIVAASVADVFGRFMLRLHRLEQDAAASCRQAPRHVANLASPTQPPVADATPNSDTATRASQHPSPHGPGGRPADRHDASRPSRLTPRQLQAALLACDGLKQPEIAIALGISPRQVARLLTQARERTGAATTGHLVAMLVTDGLVPSTQPPPVSTTHTHPR
jgi:DNA-binding CsgD family transcriptional regulator